jgi:transposase InsO family protein
MMVASRNMRRTRAWLVATAVRPQLLAELHRAHVGTDRKKSLERRYIWWPGIDGDISVLASNCESCASHQKAPPVAPYHPWLCLHLDFEGPFTNHMSLILVDAHSKWPGMVKMSIGSTTTSHTIGALRQMFSRFGIPKQLVTDNGPQFTSNEFNRFCERQGFVTHFLLHIIPELTGRRNVSYSRSNKRCERDLKTLKPN